MAIKNFASILIQVCVNGSVHKPEEEMFMFKKTVGALMLVVAMGFAANHASAATACSKDTEREGKSACAANQICYLVEGTCIEKKSLPAGKACIRSGVCKNTCVKDDGTEVKADGSEKGKCI